MLIFTAGALALSLVASRPQAPPPAQPVWTIGVVTVSGGHRYTGADLAQLAGLVHGARFDEHQLADTVKQLSETGLFTAIGYHFTTHDTTLDVAFDIEEPAWTVRVLFDNFLMISEADLMAGVRVHVPGFDGMAPSTPGFPSYLKTVLKSLLAEHGITADVAFTAALPLGAATSNDVVYTYRVMAPGLTTCAAQVAGASPGLKSEVNRQLQNLVGRDFSRYSLEQTIQEIERFTYQQKGYWAASVSATATMAGAADACSGVVIRMTVTEGDAYKFDRTIWQGNTAMSTAELDKILGMKSGAVADRGLFEKGLGLIDAAYKKRGYMTEGSIASAQFDPASHRATITVTITEGAVYTMGTLSFAGIAGDQAEALRKKWRLAPGDAFDAGYPRDFIARELSGLRGAKVDVARKVDEARHTVDLVITIK